MASAARPLNETKVENRPRTGSISDVPNQGFALERPAARADQEQREPPEIGGMRFSREQVELIKRTIAKGTTDDELQLFIMQCERTGLDPFARQIYCVKRWDSASSREVAQTQISIDGARLIAERTGKYAGQLPVQWAKVYGFDITGGDPVIKWFDVWPFVGESPYAAKARVLRTDFSEPMEAIARFDAYKQTKRDGGLTRMWSVMPDVMIAKVAEMLAIRKAFPHELRGLYSTDEMAQASNAPEAEERPSGVTADGEDTREEREPTMDEAMAYPLPGQPGGRAWGGKGGTPLGECSASLLERVEQWANAQMEKSDGFPRARELLAHVHVVRAAHGAYTPPKSSREPGYEPETERSDPPPAADAPSRSTSGAPVETAKAASSDAAPDLVQAMRDDMQRAKEPKTPSGEKRGVNMGGEGVISE